jgi:hypothetical protein
MSSTVLTLKLKLAQGQFRSSLESPESVFGATKWCVFKSIAISQEIAEAAVRQRMDRMRTEHVDLLQVCLVNCYLHPKLMHAIQVPLARLCQRLVHSGHRNIIPAESARPHCHHWSLQLRRGPHRRDLCTFPRHHCLESNPSASIVALTLGATILILISILICSSLVFAD